MRNKTVNCFRYKHVFYDNFGKFDLTLQSYRGYISRRTLYEWNIIVVSKNRRPRLFRDVL